MHARQKPVDERAAAGVAAIDQHFVKAKAKVGEQVIWQDDLDRAILVFIVVGAGPPGEGVALRRAVIEVVQQVSAGKADAEKAVQVGLVQVLADAPVHQRIKIEGLVRAVAVARGAVADVGRDLPDGIAIVEAIDLGAGGHRLAQGNDGNIARRERAYRGRTYDRIEVERVDVVAGDLDRRACIAAEIDVRGAGRAIVRAARIVRVNAVRGGDDLSGRDHRAGTEITRRAVVDRRAQHDRAVALIAAREVARVEVVACRFQQRPGLDARKWKRPRVGV